MENIPDNIRNQLPSAGKAAKEEDNQLREVIANFCLQPALERLDRVYLVNPTKAKQVEAIILNQAQQGKLAPKSITEEQIKQMLEAVSNPATVGSKVVVGTLDDCVGDGRVVLKKRVEVHDGVKDLGDDELSF
ncbi:Double-stranded_DNA-binding domain-containing protein [Hexamita inflata]|uniref:Double-stranded DNA-binding domain-containing protein n=1 Tax=Hexamita inflata TaxID=28002 RepID=A0AA86PMM7_9EUKA|nr:Double-stranded DNA-binding domain-containing protein [Hexamita inflata]CAI9959307.1 Double-stranded DNA-binding domain-containing protein [Hexamita inflata]